MTGGITASKTFHFTDGNQMKVMFNGMLQAGSFHCKIYSLLIIISTEECLNQAAEAIVANAIKQFELYTWKRMGNTIEMEPICIFEILFQSMFS